MGCARNGTIRPEFHKRPTSAIQGGRRRLLPAVAPCTGLFAFRDLRIVQRLNLSQKRLNG